MYPALASCVAVLLAIYLLAQHWKARHRRQRATKIIRRLEEALAGRGHVISFHWLAETQFEAALRFASCSFKRSSVRVEFSDSFPLSPWSWRKREESERLVFKSDLETAPRFRLSVQNQRWTAQAGKIKCLDAAQWNYEPVMPVIFTTAAEWSPELVATVVTSRANQQQQFQNVQFRKSSPHFSASMPLHIFSEGENHLEFFTALRDLATEISTSVK